MNPIKPRDVGDYKIGLYPDYVFKAFNDLIAKSFRNGSATVKQKDVVDHMLFLANSGGVVPITKQDLFDWGYLDVEEAYKNNGWKVTYDKPAYNETYDAFFVFKVNNP